MQPGERVVLASSVLVCNHPLHRGEAFEMKGSEGRGAGALKASVAKADAAKVEVEEDIHPELPTEEQVAEAEKALSENIQRVEDDITSSEAASGRLSEAEEALKQRISQLFVPPPPVPPPPSIID